MIPTINNDSSMARIRRGFAFRYTTDLMRDKQPVDVSSGTVQARLVTTDGSSLIGTVQAVASAETGANFAQGRVVVVLPSSVTNLAGEGDVTLQILWTDADDNVWPFEATLSVVAGGPALG